MDGEVGPVLMHRQASLALGALAACAVIAMGAALLRHDILSFSAWPTTRDDGRVPQPAIPDVRVAPSQGDAAALSLRHATPGSALGSPADALATLPSTVAGTTPAVTGPATAVGVGPTVPSASGPSAAPTTPSGTGPSPSA